MQEQIIHAVMNATEGALAEDLIYLSDNERITFMIVFSILLCISLVGNISAIIAAIYRNHRFIQQTSLISLALGDLCMTIAYATNNLETFSHKIIDWTLGEFLCSLIPMAQIFGLTINLASMVVIALDRYQNVVKVLAHRWNPSIWKCLTGFGLIWLICLGISYPIYPMFEIKYLTVYYKLYPERIYELEEFCITPVKNQLKLYYTIVATIIFSTLWGCFLFLNFSVAHLVWSHRKPVTIARSKYENSVSIETSTTQVRDFSSDKENFPKSPNPNLISINARRNLHVERKIRTFKIIVFSIGIFTMCRLPFWIFNILKLNNDQFNEKYHWILLYSFNALALLNCAVNPFLYSFLHPTLNVLCKCWRFCGEFGRKVCCWYCSASEFDEFGKENPFCTEIDVKRQAQANNPYFKQPVKTCHLHN